jgi:lipoprotein-anchoring transpeptidase ErfK/SrfK
MRTLLPIIALFLAWMLLSPAAARAQDGNGITSPAANTTISGTVTVEGIAVHPTFRKWQLDLLIDGEPQQAHFLALGETQLPSPGLLAAFDSTLYHNGPHTLRLRVVYLGLNYDEFFTPILIQNAGAPPSPRGSTAGTETGAETGPETLAETDALTETGATAAEPAPVVFRTDAPADGKKWIEIDISDQRLVAWQGDVPVFETIVSTGKPGWRTLPGVFNVYRKYDQTRMRGIDYDTPDVPWTMYYSGAFAIHGAYWHNNFGTPVSHGCVNLRVPEAKALYEWAPMGTEVVVNQ